MILAQVLAIVGLSFVLLSTVIQKFPRWEQRLIVVSFAAHVATALLMLVVSEIAYGGGDHVIYHRHGTLIADAILTDTAYYLPKTVELLFQIGGHELVPHGGGESTGSMFATVALLGTILGRSIIVQAMVITMFGFFAKLLLFQVFRSALPATSRKAIIFSMLLIPSAIFWSSGVIKEAMAMIFLSVMVYGARLLTSRAKKIHGFTALLVGAVGCSLFKAYILVPFAIALAAAYYAATTSFRNLTLPKLALSSGLALVLLLVIGTIFPRYDVRNAPEQFALEQKSFSAVSGGSDFDAVGGLSSDTSPGSYSSWLATAPVAVITALFRPFIFEARSILVLFSALETLLLVLLLGKAYKIHGVRGGLRQIIKSPPLAFALVFALVFALGVGYTTANLGTLARYRMPLMPFFALVLLSLATKQAPSRKTAV